MSLDESWDAYRARLHEHHGVEPPSIVGAWLTAVVTQVEREALASGQLRYAQKPGDWFRSIRWSPTAWTALHGAEGPRGR